MVLIGILSGLGGGAFIFLIYDIFRCKHQWEFVDKTEFPAPIEEARKAQISNIWLSDLPGMCKKTVVIVIRCTKCGASKVMRETH